MALPAVHLDDLDREVIARGGHTLVSNNPCAAHEPRLAAVPKIWEDHAAFLATLGFAAPRLALLGTLTADSRLEDPAALRANRHDTTFHRVRWDDTLRALPALGVRRVVMFGPPSCGYAFKKFRASLPRRQEPAFRHRRDPCGDRRTSGPVDPGLRSAPTPGSP